MACSLGKQSLPNCDQNYFTENIKFNRFSNHSRLEIVIYITNAVGYILQRECFDKNRAM
jgi:hypothetical protein